MPKRPKRYASTYKEHKEKWSKCVACELCKNRSRIVLARGTLPCDVLIIGEAPGASEDVLGKPFIGPAGKLLDQLVQRACDEAGFAPKIAFTNLVACLPMDESTGKIGEPPTEAIKACEPRLKEIVRLCKPEVIVLAGKLAAKHVSGQAQFDCDWTPEITFVEIVHPAAITRMDASQKSIACMRCVVTMRDAFDTLLPF